MSVSATLMLLASCGGGDAAQNGVAPDDGIVAAAPTPTPSPTPSPTPPPTETGTKGPAGYVQLASIASNFDTSGMLHGVRFPETNAPDVVGAFRFTCKPSHNAYDDPIVFPGQPGRAHLHTFFGNTLTNANSTYESLRTTGESTCRNELNRSAYWIPAMLNGVGQVVMPSHITIYYKRAPQTDEACTTKNKCIAIPRGLRYVFGRTMDGLEGYKGHFKCRGGGAKYDTIPEVAENCELGGQIGAVLDAPQCWNGTELDSANHRTHMAYRKRDRMTGEVACPDTHPYEIPTFTLSAWYDVDESLDRTGDMSTDLKTWYFASDRVEGKPAHVSGSTFHADWFGAWDDDVLKQWTDNCIDKLLSCNDGNLGNGQMLQNNELTKSDTPRLVAVPPRII
ncbi:DUF1996 domain-containing protein [Qipengyuania atrilutea]|uniref:DUF1996 domain-containing protein n=1 Tax=Qipengyuania atrilutea TaxID=2744473 RepID=A0A850H535_9SPHN|nr:DUF1996 domain-containing protein [Actirhodobacter atriluteus]NVD45760.1 DUF1996 domain-containing protein [Actirhodobacter atriluteus]